MKIPKMTNCQVAITRRTLPEDGEFQTLNQHSMGVHRVAADSFASVQKRCGWRCVQTVPATKCLCDGCRFVATVNHTVGTFGVTTGAA